MSIKTRIAAFALAATVATGAIASSTHAEAKPFGPGFGFGAAVLGAAVVGSAIAASSGPQYYDYGYRRCGWAPRYNAYGDFIGRVRTCNY
jgi:hypothetical protein